MLLVEVELRPRLRKRTNGPPYLFKSAKSVYSRASASEFNAVK